MEFKEGTPVYTANGEKIGSIERFVLDPRAKKVMGLVVRKGFLFTEDRVVPVDRVVNASEDRVDLDDYSDPEDFPPFEERHYISPDQAEIRNQYQRELYAPVYYYPPFGVPVQYGPEGHIPEQQTVKERNIPEHAVALKEGANVFTRDEKNIGQVREIFTDSTTDAVTHFSITQGLFFKEVKTLPVAWIDTATDDEIYLAVSSQTLERLGDY